MVRQVIHEAITYYHPDGGVQIVNDAPLDGQGKAWTLGAYEPPLYPSPLNVRVGNAGIKVWMVINWLQLCNDDTEELLRRYGQVLTADDVRAAQSYYEEQNREEIDRRIAEEGESA